MAPDPFKYNRPTCERSWGSDGDEMKELCQSDFLQGLKAAAAFLMGWDPTARKKAGKSVSK